jgi:hypothetical protein
VYFAHFLKQSFISLSFSLWFRCKNSWNTVVGIVVVVIVLSLLQRNLTVIGPLVVRVSIVVGGVVVVLLPLL